MKGIEVVVDLCSLFAVEEQEGETESTKGRIILS
ncbi:MAG: hypothetical protein QOI68_5816 [Pseudonocardiales bacterium]|jgi:hypothetical protein|nr:hypothetical protein [Pseudonocardiales bacterium]